MPMLVMSSLGRFARARHGSLAGFGMIVELGNGFVPNHSLVLPDGCGFPSSGVPPCTENRIGDRC